METLAVALLLFLLTNIWGVGGYLVKKVSDMDKKLGKICSDNKDQDERLDQVDVTVDDHEGRIQILREDVDQLQSP